MKPKVTVQMGHVAVFHPSLDLRQAGTITADVPGVVVMNAPIEGVRYYADQAEIVASNHGVDPSSLVAVTEGMKPLLHRLNPEELFGRTRTTPPPSSTTESLPKHCYERHGETFVLEKAFSILASSYSWTVPNQGTTQERYVFEIDEPIEIYGFKWADEVWVPTRLELSNPTPDGVLVDGPGAPDDYAWPWP